ncbi:MAG: DUF4397 domain-containing protein [Anaerolineaceae bacterium]|nr:DUF4397 domain-containing protein [Anaerolineaceae bacterium]
MRYVYRVLLLICTLVIVAACGQAQVIPIAIVIPTTEPTATAAPTFTPQVVSNERLEQARPALVRIVNAAVESPPLNVFAGFSAIATNLAYKQFTEPTSFDAGKYTVKLQASGSSPGDKSLLESELTFPSGVSVIVLVTGTGNQLTLTTLTDKQEALKATENIIHVINGLSDNATVSLKNSGTDLATGVQSGQSSLTPIISAGKADLSFQVGDKALDYSTNLKEQTNTTLVVVGTTADAAIVQFESAAPKRISVRAINASADINTIDVYLDDQLLTSQVGYGRPTDRQNFASGQYTVRVYAAGADRNTVEPLSGQVVSLIDGENFAVALLGSASQLSILAFPEDLSPTPIDQTRISFLNTLPRLSEVDVQATAAQMTGIPTLFYGQAPSVMNVQAGKYSFIMGGLDRKNTDGPIIRTTIERAENIQFESGYAYLYLVTGRIDTPPIILSDKVNTTSEASGDSPSPAVGQQAATIRFINAMQGQTLDFAINGTPVITGLNYGEGSKLSPVTEQSVTVSVNTSGQTNALGQQDSTFEVGSRYSVVAYRAEDDAVGLLVINDDNLIFDGTSPHLRFINVTPTEDSRLGLAFSAPDKNDATPDNSSAAPAAATPEVTVDPNLPEVVYTLPFGVQKLVSDIGPSSPSSVILMPVGTFDLDIIDSSNNRLAITIPKMALEAGIHTDVIAFQPPNSSDVVAFAVVYPQPQA